MHTESVIVHVGLTLQLLHAYAAGLSWKCRSARGGAQARLCHTSGGSLHDSGHNNCIQCSLRECAVSPAAFLPTAWLRLFPGCAVSSLQSFCVAQSGPVQAKMLQNRKCCCCISAANNRTLAHDQKMPEAAKLLCKRSPLPCSSARDAGLLALPSCCKYSRHDCSSNCILFFFMCTCRTALKSRGPALQPLLGDSPDLLSAVPPEV